MREGILRDKRSNGNEPPGGAGAGDVPICTLDHEVDKSVDPTTTFANGAGDFGS